MSTTVTLGEGRHASLRDKLSVQGRRILGPYFTDMVQHTSQRFPNLADLRDLDLNDEDRAVLTLGGLDGDLVAAFSDFQAAAIVAFVESWSYGPPPSMDTVYSQMGDDIEAFDLLAERCSQLALDAMKPKQWGPEGAGDPESPTVPSSASDGGWRDHETRSTIPARTGLTPSPNGVTGQSFT